MCLTEYNEEKLRDVYREEGQDRVIRLIGHLSKDGRVSDIIRASEDPTYLKVLLDEYE